MTTEYSTAYYAVLDAATGAIKRNGTCTESDVELQASEPGETVIRCPGDMRDDIAEYVRLLKG